MISANCVGFGRWNASVQGGARMKPKNFPGNTNKRRIAAFQRIKRTDGPLPPDQHNLVTKIVSQDTARAIRTKKRRQSTS